MQEFGDASGVAGIVKRVSFTTVGDAGTAVK